MMAIPTAEQEDAKRPHRERGNLITEQTRIARVAASSLRGPMMRIVSGKTCARRKSRLAGRIPPGAAGLPPGRQSRLRLLRAGLCGCRASRRTGRIGAGSPGGLFLFFGLRKDSHSSRGLRRMLLREIGPFVRTEHMLNAGVET